MDGSDALPRVEDRRRRTGEGTRAAALVPFVLLSALRPPPLLPSLFRSPHLALSRSLDERNLGSNPLVARPISLRQRLHCREQLTRLFPANCCTTALAPERLGRRGQVRATREHLPARTRQIHMPFTEIIALSSISRGPFNYPSTFSTYSTISQGISAAPARLSSRYPAAAVHPLNDPLLCHCPLYLQLRTRTTPYINSDAVSFGSHRGAACQSTFRVPHPRPASLPRAGPLLGLSIASLPRSLSPWAVYSAGQKLSSGPHREELRSGTRLRGGAVKAERRGTTGQASSIQVLRSAATAVLTQY